MKAERAGGTVVRLMRVGTRAGVLSLIVLMGACAMKSDVRDLQTEMRAMMLRQDSAYIALHQAIQRANGETRDTLNAYAETLFQFRGDVTNNLLDIQAQLLQLGELTGQSQRSLAGLRDQLEDQRRRYFRITELGSKVLQAEAARLQRLLGRGVRQRLLDSGLEFRNDTDEGPRWRSDTR